ncbi:MAG: hypothetical protein JXJ20_02305 [Anaerolineae bacterium]|jgi:hypothetical protein|nr:hypothetical protein [Anaerolineae bacterium]
MFTPKPKRNLVPYYRALYCLQLVAVGAILAGMFLDWWAGSRTVNAFWLLNRGTRELREHDPNMVIQPLLVLWLLVPMVLISGLRSFTGILVTPVSYQRLALLAWGAGLLALGHFYISFSDELPYNSPLDAGEIQPGFWLTGTSSTILGLLILAEYLFHPRRDRFLPADGPAAPVDDAERLWRGDYVSCPYCGMLNEPTAKACYNCNNLLFHFLDNDRST